MRTTEDVSEFLVTARDWEAGANGDGVGPQEAALILELQRLRKAFEHRERGDPALRKPQRATHRSARSGARQRTPHRKKPPKGKMGRVIDICLQQFGFAAARGGREGNEQTSNDAPPRRASVPTPNRAYSIDATPSDQERDRLTDDHQLMRIECPPMQLPLSVAPTKSIAVGQLLGICGKGVSTSFAFLINPEAISKGEITPGNNLKVRAGRAFERELRAGVRVLLAVTVIAGGWAALIPLAGAVVVPGNLVVQSNVKSIQHPTGGVIAEIAVHNGQRVGSGDLLLRLDATQARASLQVLSKQLDEVRARIARLVAERDKLAELQTPPELVARSGDPTVKAVIASEETVFRERANARRSQTDLLQSRVSQLGEEIVGLEAQVASKNKQLELIAGELSGVQELYDKRLVPLTRLTSLQRETARIEGERGQLVSSIAETKSKIGEAQLQIVRIEQDFRTDVVKELGENRAKEAELVERSVAAQDVLDRIEIRAPTSGVIHQLSVHTLGGVIRASESVMEIVPDSDDLQIEARLQPNEIDQVRRGQQAFVRFSAFNQRVTPQLTGIVTYVSADTSRDQQTNVPYFTVRVALSEDEIRRLAGLQLVPGMPAEVFMQTGSRTMMNYLLKPIADQMRRAFVER